MKVARSAPSSIADAFVSPTTSCTTSASSMAAPTMMSGSSTRRPRSRWWAASRPSRPLATSSTTVRGWSTREAYGVGRCSPTRHRRLDRTVGRAGADGSFVPKHHPRPRAPERPHRPEGAVVSIRPIAVDRAAGVLLGEACGDALGVPYEMAAPPVGEAVMKGGGLGPYEPGEWSDDTQMTLCVARIAAQGIDLTSPEGLDGVADAFTAWLDGGEGADRTLARTPDPGERGTARPHRADRRQRRADADPHRRPVGPRRPRRDGPRRPRHRPAHPRRPARR